MRWAATDPPIYPDAPVQNIFIPELQASRAELGDGRSIGPTSPQMLLEKLRRPAPGEFRGLAVMHGLPLLVDEGVLGVIAEQLQRLAGGLHALLEGIDHLRRAPVILVGEMRLQWNLHIRGLGCLLWRNAVEHHAGRQLRNFGGADDGHRAAEAEAG